MKLIFRSTILILLLTLGTINLIAQSECSDFLEKKCGGFGPPYKFSGQSRSASFERGQTSNFKMSAFSGFEYCVSLCATKQLKDIYFRIIEDTPQKTVLYDGANDETGMLQKEFYVKNSKKLLVEVVVPKPEKDIEDLNYNQLNGCVAVIIEYNKVGKKGFN